MRRPAAVLFATDIAARGLDFPSCDWVVQVDAPEDAAMYIHRVGRTARYTSGGRSLLFLLPSEEAGMLALLKEAHVAGVKRLTVNPHKTASVKQKAASVVAANMECKRLAHKAFCSYVRSVALMPRRDVFDVAALDTDAFADSLGLPKPPSTKFLKPLLLQQQQQGSGEGAEGAEGAAELGREGVRAKKNKSRALERLKEKIKRERAERAGKRVDEGKGKGKGDASDDGSSSGGGSDSDSEGEGEGGEGGLLVVKQTHAWGEGSKEEEAALAALLEKRKRRKPEKLKISLDAPTGQGKKIVFAEDEEEDEEESEEEESESESEGEEEAAAAAVMGQQDMAVLKAKNEAYVQAVQRRLAASRGAFLLWGHTWVWNWARD